MTPVFNCTTIPPFSLTNAPTSAELRSMVPITSAPSGNTPSSTLPFPSLSRNNHKNFNLKFDIPINRLRQCFKASGGILAPQMPFVITSDKCYLARLISLFSSPNSFFIQQPFLFSSDFGARCRGRTCALSVQSRLIYHNSKGLRELNSSPRLSVPKRLIKGQIRTGTLSLLV